MNKKTCKVSVLLAVTLFFVAGCATTRARKADPAAVQSAQITELQQQVQAKDQQIQNLQSQLTSGQQSSGGGNFSSGSAKADKSSFIRVSGVSVTDVQSALIRAGYDPGSVDGRAGKKTKSTIKKFQRKHNLAADGIVGEKTWNRLK
ncbi:MAG: hypothetical protein AUJ71_00310 [Candidatus Omnitrophica bacterium CG1_02_49_16]|nr:MAG: hypothetical protein AUJ71_00310 [Candidatus Omnitrophica bacterium CG1_02_49_16]